MVGEGRVAIEAETFTGKYRNGAGIVREVSTGCRTKDAARAFLSELEARAEKVKAGVMTAAESALADWQTVPLSDQVQDYLTYLSDTGASKKHIYERGRMLSKVMTACRFVRVSDLSRPPLERMLVNLKDEGAGARTRNTYRAALVAFCSWLVKQSRMTGNPFVSVHTANERTDKRRIRRVLTDDEIGRLLEAAEKRPLSERQVNRGSVAKLAPGTMEALQLLGQERRLSYALMLETGLRANECRTLTMGDLNLKRPASLEIKTVNEKAKRGAQLPLRDEITAQVEAYLARRLRVEQTSAQAHRKAIPMLLGHDALVFPHFPAGIRVFDRDLAFADIPKRDDAGRVVDMHALRHTYCTRLARAGVPVAIAQRPHAPLRSRVDHGALHAP